MKKARQTPRILLSCFLTHTCSEKGLISCLRDQGPRMTDNSGGGQSLMCLPSFLPSAHPQCCGIVFKPGPTRPSTALTDSSLWPVQEQEASKTVVECLTKTVRCEQKALATSSESVSHSPLSSPGQPLPTPATWSPEKSGSHHLADQQVHVGWAPPMVVVPRALPLGQTRSAY